MVTIPYKNFRRRPEKVERLLTSSQIATVQPSEDIRGVRLSSMDEYVLAHEDERTRCLYRRLVLKLFIAYRIV